MRIRSFLLLGALGAAFLLASCGGGGDDSSSGSGDDVGFLISDAPTDGLAAVMADVVDLRLLRPDGSATGNLLQVPRTFDFISLASTRSLLRMADVPDGTYTGVRLRIDPASVRVVAKAGGVVPVVVDRSQDDCLFSDLGESPLVVGSGFERILVDVPLDQTLSDDTTNPGGKRFALKIRCEHEFPDDSGFDEFHGRVTEMDPTSNTFECMVMDDSGSGFGEVHVVVDDSDVLLDDGRALAGTTAFFAALRIGAEVEVHGYLGRAGNFQADRVEIEDVSSEPYRLRGQVLSVDSGAETFELLWTRVDRGSSTVHGTMAALGNPAVITVAWDGSTRFEGEDGASATVAQLIPGAKVKCGFPAFSGSEPFFCTTIEFDDEGAEFEGTITDDSGLPASLELTLDSDEPAVTSGQVTAPVTVDLTGTSNVFLDVEGRPSLAKDDVLAGMKAEAHGQLSGPPNAAAVQATKFKVKPGRLQGTLVAVSPGAGTITIQVSDVDDPWGVAIAGTETFAVASGAALELEGSTTTLSGLQSALSGLGPGEELEVERAKGIGDASGGDPIVWELEVRVK